METEVREKRWRLMARNALISLSSLKGVRQGALGKKKFALGS